MTAFFPMTAFFAMAAFFAMTALFAMAALVHHSGGFETMTVRWAAWHFLNS